MKILVVGGTGLIGKQVCKKLESSGNTVVVGSPSAGVDILTGQGLAHALEGTDIVVDLSNSKSPDAQEALNFFTRAAGNLMAAEQKAEIKHHLVLSIVGTDRAPHIGYLKAKTYQEDAVVKSGIPYTIIRSTQFHEHTSTILAVQSEGDKIHVSNVDYQPIAVEDVVNFVVRFALEKPKNRIVEIAGPDRAPMNVFVESFLKATNDHRSVVTNEDNSYMLQTIPKTALVPEGDFYSGKVRFEDWQNS